MPKGKRGSRGKRKKSERIISKMSARVSKRILRGRDPLAVANEAMRRFRQTGEETPGVRLIGHWRNPDNKNPKHSNWKTSEDEGQSLEGFRESILERVGISAKQLTFDSVLTPQPQPKAPIKSPTEKRSAAAKAGWVTRKREAAATARLAEMRKRTAAAKKGWATRKAKGGKK